MSRTTMDHPHFPFAKTVSTQRLLLAPADLQILQTAIQGDGLLSELMGIHVAENWNEFGMPVLEIALKQMIEEPKDALWWSWLVILRQENVLVGMSGYKGHPNSDREIEMGYSVAPAYRNRGIATEIVAGLLDNAFGNRKVDKVLAQTLAGENASVSVLRKQGFQKVAELVDPEEGVIWRWEIERNHFSPP